jgi:hypothetical protein
LVVVEMQMDKGIVAVMDNMECRDCSAGEEPVSMAVHNWKDDDNMDS